MLFSFFDLHITYKHNWKHCLWKGNSCRKVWHKVALQECGWPPDSWEKTQAVSLNFWSQISNHYWKRVQFSNLIVPSNAKWRRTCHITWRTFPLLTWCLSTETFSVTAFDLIVIRRLSMYCLYSIASLTQCLFQLQSCRYLSVATLTDCVFLILAFY